MTAFYQDRSFQYGDGVFSTIRVVDHQLQLWPAHWARLHASLQRLAIAVPDQQQLRDLANAQITQSEQVVKVLVSRGQGARGYSSAGIKSADIYSWAAPLPNYQPWRSQGIHLGAAAMQLSMQPLLAGIKHCSRLETVLLKQEVDKSDCDELLVSDQQGLLVEASSSNVVLLLDGEWWTPTLSNAGVAGVMRQQLLDAGLCQETQLGFADALAATAIVLTNCLMGAVPVRQYQQKRLALEPAIKLQQQLDVYLMNQ